MNLWDRVHMRKSL